MHPRRCGIVTVRPVDLAGGQPGIEQREQRDVTSGDQAATAAQSAGDLRVYGGFADLLKPEAPWQIGGFALPDGSFWQYREPNAVVIAQAGRLRCSAVPLTRSHAQVQILDNAKHMYFSRERFAVPAHGSISFDVNIGARGVGTAPRDLYDGFVSYNLLDFASGWALDFFVSNDTIATVYARLPFPGVTVPATGPVRYFALFKELEIATTPGQRHDYRITYDHAGDAVSWYVDGALVNREEQVPDKLNGFTVAMGLMTEKDLGRDGSTSLHGQGLIGDWSATTVSTDGAPITSREAARFKGERLA